MSEAEIACPTVTVVQPVPLYHSSVPLDGSAVIFTPENGFASASENPVAPRFAKVSKVAVFEGTVAEVLAEVGLLLKVFE